MLHESDTDTEGIVDGGPPRCEDARHRGILLDAALRYEALGWSIIPIGLDKKPLVVWKSLQTKRATPDRLRKWFGGGTIKRPIEGLAVVLGSVSGDLIGRDFDDGEESYRRWAEENPDLARSLPTVRTSRGYHVYARSVGATPQTVRGRGERRVDGQLLILPPSRHPSGRIYEWIIEPGGLVPEVEAERLLVDDLQGGESHTPSVAPPSTTPPTWPVLSELSGVSTSSMSQEVQDAVFDTVPNGKGERNQALFQYLRRLKAMPEYAEVPVEVIRPAVRFWWRAAHGAIGTKDWESTWADAVHGWPRVRFAAGSGPMEEIAKAAAAADVPACAAALGYTAAETLLLVKICRELQQRHGTEPFWLTCTAAAKYTGLPRNTAARRLNMLAVDGILIVVKKGGRERGQPPQATQYRYIGDGMSLPAAA